MRPDTRVTDVLRAIAEVANEVLRGHFCVVQPYDAENDRFLLEQFTTGGTPEATTFKWNEPRPHGSARTTLEKGLLIVNDYDKELQHYPFLEGSTGSFKDFADVKALIGVRLEAAGEKVGVLFVDYLEPHEFTEEEIETLRLFAGQAAIAIKNARLFESVNQSTQQLEQKVQQLGALQAMTRTVVETLNLNDVLDVFLQSVTEGLGFEYAVVSLVDENRRRIESKRMIWEGQIDAWPGFLQMSNYPLDDKDILASIVRAGKTEIIDHWDPRFNKEIWDKYNHERLLRIYMPVKGRRGQVIGVVEAGFDKSHRLSIEAEEQEALEAYVNQASIGIQNARLYGGASEQLQQALVERNKILSLVQQIDHWVLQEGGEVEDLAEFTIGRLLDMFSFEAGWLLLTEGLEMSVLAADPQHLADKGRRLRQDASISGYVSTTKRTVRTGNLAAAPEHIQHLYQPVAGGNRMTSILAVPLVVEDRCIGVLDLESTNEDAFTEHHQELMEVFAGHLAVALESARSQQDTELLSKVAREASGSLDVELVAQHVLNQALERIGGRSGGDKLGQILFIDGDTLTVQLATGGEGLGSKLLIEDCASGLVLLSAEDPYRKQLVEAGVIRICNDSVIIPDVSKVMRYQRLTHVGDIASAPEYHGSTDKEMKSELIVPLKAGGKVVAVLNLESSLPAYFTDEHALFLEPIAGYAATAILNAKAAETQRRAEAFARFGELLHRLNNPLAAIDARVQLMPWLHRELIESYPALSADISEIQQNISEALTAVASARAMDDEPLAPTAIAAALDEALAKLEMPKNIEIHRDRQSELELPLVRATPTLRDVFFNIMENAVRYMPQGGWLTISASVDLRNSWVDVFICDTGKGIEKEMWSTILGGFSERSGIFHGLGLQWSRYLVEKYGGELVVHSSDIGKGTCFRVRLAIGMG